MSVTVSNALLHTPGWESDNACDKGAKKKIAATRLKASKGPVAVHISESFEPFPGSSCDEGPSEVYVGKLRQYKAWR